MKKDNHKNNNNLSLNNVKLIIIQKNINYLMKN